MEKYCRAVQATDDNIIRLMRTACWIPKAENTHSEYVTYIAFPLQQWLTQRASMLRIVPAVLITDLRWSQLSVEFRQLNNNVNMKYCCKVCVMGRF